MPGNPGAWTVVRDKPSACEAPELTAKQKQDCHTEGGAVIFAILLAFAVFAAVMFSRLSK
jgi:hypothetical protein